MTNPHELHIPEHAMRFTSQVLEWMYGTTGETCGPLLTKDSLGPVLRGTPTEFHRLAVAMAQYRQEATAVASSILEMDFYAGTPT